MIARTCKRQALLALCFLPGLASGVSGKGGQQNRLPQSVHAFRHMPERGSATRGQHRPASRTFSSMAPQGLSHNPMQSRQMIDSSSARRTPGSVHVNPIRTNTASGSVGSHDFNHGLGMQQQGPWAGRGLQFPGLFAVDHRNQAIVRQEKRRLDARAAVAGTERSDRRVGGEAARYSFQHRAGYSGGRGRSGARPSLSYRQR